MNHHPSSLRQAICFALDTSQSMGGDKIDSLNEGLSELYRLVKADPDARAMTDVAVVTFGAGVHTVAPFDNIAKQVAPRLTVGGATPMGEAVKRCAELIQKHQTGTTQKPAILVIAADGRPTDNTLEAAAHCFRMSQANQLVVYPVAVGQDAYLDSSVQFAPGGVMKETSTTAVANLFRDIGHIIIKSSARRSVFDKPVLAWDEAMRTNHQ